MRTKIVVAAASLAAALTGLGCDARELPSESPIGQSEHELIGGFRASGSSLNAVGTVGIRDFFGRYQFFCSATLIAPQVVLTAKHCAIITSGVLKGMKLVNVNRIYFAVGPDANNPIKVVEAIASEVSPVDLRGMVELGNDMATYQLIEPITDVTPIPVGSASFTDQDLGQRYLAMGFGSKDVFEDVTGFLTAERRAGYMTLRALRGKPLQVIYPNFDAFLDDLRFTDGEELVQFFLPELREIWESAILDGYEAWLGLDSTQKAPDGTSDAQGCHGDSGGPLLSIGAKREIRGVASAVLFSRQLTCDRGTFYATIGPRTREMLEAALAYRDPCTGVTTEGTCDGTVAIRCTDKFEGDRRLSRLDCADLGMVCRPGGDGVAGCFDEGESPETPPDGGVGPVDGAVPPRGEGGTARTGDDPRAPGIQDIRAMIRRAFEGRPGE